MTESVTIHQLLMALAGLGVLGNILSRFPWQWAQRLGRAMSAVGPDVTKLVQAARGKTSSGFPIGSVPPPKSNVDITVDE